MSEIKAWAVKDPRGEILIESLRSGPDWQPCISDFMDERDGFRTWGSLKDEGWNCVQVAISELPKAAEGAEERCLKEWAGVNDRPCHPSDEGWSPCVLCKDAPPIGQPEAGKDTPFANCRFKICDLPGQCRSEGKCHHPAAEGQNAAKDQAREPTDEEWRQIQKLVDDDCPISIVAQVAQGKVLWEEATDRIAKYATAAFTVGISAHLAAQPAEGFVMVRDALVSAEPFISELAGAGNEHAPRALRKIQKALAALTARPKPAAPGEG